MAMGSSWDDHVREALRDAGVRTGGARETVIAHLGSQDCCLSAQELFDEIRAAGRSIGLASVYRALDQLADAKLVHRIDLGDGVGRYEPARPGGEHHHHLVCGGCGRLETFNDHILERALSRIARSHGYRLDDHDVVLHGACADCRA